MSISRARVTLEFTDNFTGRMRLAAEAADQLTRTMALAGATWEPHDWSDFS